MYDAAVSIPDAFLRDIIAHPDDDSYRLIYADWLDDRGQSEEAAMWRAVDYRDRIDTLSDAQKSLLPVWRDQWLRIGLSTQTPNKAAVQEAIIAAYRAGGLPPPTIWIWLDSPLQGAIGAAALAQVRDQVRDQVGDQVWAQVRDQVRDQVGDQVWAQVWDQVGAQVRAQVRDQVWDQVRAQVWDQVWDRCGYGAHDAHWIAFYQYLAIVCRLGAGRSLYPLARVTVSGCGFWWPFAGAVICTALPTLLRWGRANDRPIIMEFRYPDGWGWAREGGVYCAAK